MIRSLAKVWESIGGGSPSVQSEFTPATRPGHAPGDNVAGARKRGVRVGSLGPRDLSVSGSNFPAAYAH